jgi:hypothetical protein
LASQWETVLEINEEDLQHLGFKRGHRRVLQREIERFKQEQRHDAARATPLASGGSSAQSGNTPTPPDEHSSSSQRTKTKRKYRWHPRPDPNAPKRPKTAYVRFADHLRRNPDVAGMSFVDIAKEVGWRWQQTEAAVKQKYELEAARDIQEYEDQMRAYKQTAKYGEYQVYLETFRKDPSKPSRPKLRNHPPYDASHSAPALSASPQRTDMSSPGSSNGTTSLPEECERLVAHGIDEFQRLILNYRETTVFNLEQPPPKEIVRPSILALIENSGPLIYSWGEGSLMELFERVYSHTAVDRMPMAELYAASALGSYYSPRQVAPSMVYRLMVTSFTLLGDVDLTRMRPERLLRLLVCLAIYAAQEKHMSCRALIGELKAHRFLQS